MHDRGIVDGFRAGAIGEPGQRTFLLQFENVTGVESYVLEKTQVAVLAEQSLELLAQIGLPGAGVGDDVTALDPPDEIAFRVGTMQLAYEEAARLITLVVGSTDQDEEAVAYRMTPAVLGAAMRHALEVVAAGRPSCPRCGLAMDPDGHHCPQDNGDLRQHRV